MLYVAVFFHIKQWKAKRNGDWRGIGNSRKRQTIAGKRQATEA
jgi:hypothetical protein